MPSYNPPNGFYTQITLPNHINPDIFIGYKGYHLKRISELTGCDYLWYNWSRGVIEIWSKECFRLPKAKNMLANYISKF